MASGGGVRDLREDAEAGARLTALLLVAAVAGPEQPAECSDGPMTPASPDLGDRDLTHARESGMDAPRCRGVCALARSSDANFRVLVGKSPPCGERPGEYCGRTVENQPSSRAH